MQGARTQKQACTLHIHIVVGDMHLALFLGGMFKEDNSIFGQQFIDY